MGTKPQINKNTKRLITSLSLIALALIAITGCAQATESELASVEAKNSAALDPTPKPDEPANTPKPVGSTLESAETTAPIDSAVTLTPTEARPATAPRHPDRSDSGAEGPETLTPTPTDKTDSSSPDSNERTANPTPTTLAPQSPVPTPPPPTEITFVIPPTQSAEEKVTSDPAPTPRPTPGPITRQTQFVPLDEPAYVTRENASANIKNDSYVLGVANNGEARAYPLDMMWYHHIANDTVGGEPWLITY